MAPAGEQSPAPASFHGAPSHSPDTARAGRQCTGVWPAGAGTGRRGRRAGAGRRWGWQSGRRRRIRCRDVRRPTGSRQLLLPLCTLHTSNQPLHVRFKSEKEMGHRQFI